MKSSRKYAILTLAIWFASNMATAQPSPANKTATQSRIAFSQALPRLDGANLAVKMVEVTYPPGGSSTPHSHPCPVTVYVISGALRTQVKGSAEAIHKAGESFYEAPNGVHQISANASQTEPAKFLAYFICDHDTPLSVPAAADK